MQNPLDARERLLDRFKILQRLRIKKPNGIVVAFELDQKSPLAVAVSTGTFSVDCHGSGAGAKFFRRVVELCWSVDDRWYATGGLSD
ncbi:hypothetical protein GCM10022249_08850 [Enteractinococcus coprophilus]